MLQTFHPHSQYFRIEACSVGNVIFLLLLLPQSPYNAWAKYLFKITKPYSMVMILRWEVESTGGEREIITVSIDNYPYE